MIHLLVILALALSSSASAKHRKPQPRSGGSCPSAVNYINWQNPGTQVTLASLGITSCYYIAANGSDSNDGLSEAAGHPWLHAPGMPAATNNPLSVWNSVLPAGAGLIFRGGDTWHEGNSSASPYTGGTFGLNRSPGPAGTQANPIYVGVDLAWYAGGSWARPILTWDNPTTTSQSLSGCTYNSYNVIDFSGGAYFIFDDFELTGVCAGSASPNPIYVSYGSMSGGFFAYRNYLHGSSHVAFPNVNNCTQYSTCMSAFRGGTNSGYPIGDVLMFNVVDFYADSDPVPMEGCYCGSWNVAYNYFSGISQYISRSLYLFHDNVETNFVDNGHANVLESVGDLPGPANVYAIYNNVFSNLYVSSTVNSNVCFWPYPPIGSKLYWFNNLVYNAAACEFFNLGQNGVNAGSVYMFNSTFQNIHRTDGGANGISCSSSGNTEPYTNANIHWISDDQSNPYASNCTGQGTDTTRLSMTNAAANTAGYTSTPPAYSPSSSGSPTVGAGTNLVSANCNALSSAASTDSNLSNAAAACTSDTTYGVVYNTSTHTVSTPGRTSVARPSSSAWSIGAYEPSGGAGPTYYNFTVSTAGTGSGNVTTGPTKCLPGSQNYLAGTLIGPCTAVPSAGSTFTSWSGVTGSAACSGSTNPCPSFTLNAATTLTANFAINTYTLAVSTVGPGNITGPNCAPGTYNWNTSIGPCTANPNAGGATFTGWTGVSGSAGCSGTTNPCPSFAITSNSGLTANFQAAPSVVASPTFSPLPGTYTGTQSVTLSTATSGATIRYTTDTSTPTDTQGTIYTAPISVAASVTIKAIGYESGYTDSPVVTGAYTINPSGPGPGSGTITGPTIFNGPVHF